MTFGNPAWLWALLALPALHFALEWDDKRRRSEFEAFAQPGVWPRIAPEYDPAARPRKARVWMAAFAFLVLAVARPQWGTHEETLTMTGLDVLFVIDVSNSMSVEDVAPSRLKKAKHMVTTVLERLGGDRAGLVAFAGSAYVAAPLTTDHAYVDELLEILGPRMVVNQGTDIAVGLETAVRSLDRGAEQVSGGAGQPVSRVVVLISDGEDHEGAAGEWARKMKEAGIRLYVFGIGTEKGGPVPVRDGNGQLRGYKKDRAGNPVISAFNPASLTEIASVAGGRYWNVTPAEAEVDELLADLDALTRGEYSEKRYVVRLDRYQIPLAIAVLLLLVELGLAARRIGTAAGALLLLLAGAAAPAEAAPVQSYLKNEKGRELFGEGKTEEAQRQFGEAQALDPTLAELQFNQGAARLKLGEVDGAIGDFAGSAKEALDRGDQALAGKSLFNLGQALTKKGDVRGAVRSYLGAIDSAVAAKDPKLEADARKNLQLLVKTCQKQKQQQQEQKDKKDEQEQKDKKDEQGKNDKKGDEKQDQKDQQAKGGEKEEKEEKKQPERYQDTSKNPKRNQFRSLKLSKEDADRVMSELQNRERELQTKLNKQKGNPVTQQKDW